MHIRPVQRQRLTLMHAGANEHLEQLRQRIPNSRAILQERDRFCRRRAHPFRPLRPRQDRMPRGVVRQPTLRHRISQRARERGHTSAQRHGTASRGKLVRGTAQHADNSAFPTSPHRERARDPWRDSRDTVPTSSASTSTPWPPTTALGSRRPSADHRPGHRCVHTPTPGSTPAAPPPSWRNRCGVASGGARSTTAYPPRTPTYRAYRQPAWNTGHRAAFRPSHVSRTADIPDPIRIRTYFRSPSRGELHRVFPDVTDVPTQGRAACEHTATTGPVFAGQRRTTCRSDTNTAEPNKRHFTLHRESPIGCRGKSRGLTSGSLAGKQAVRTVGCASHNELRE